MLVRVKFKKSMGAYNKGDLAGFSEAKAKELAKRGIAEIDGDGKPKAVKAEK